MKQINLFLMALLIISQTILGPIGASVASAEGLPQPASSEVADEVEKKEKKSKTAESEQLEIPEKDSGKEEGGKPDKPKEPATPIIPETSDDGKKDDVVVPAPPKDTPVVKPDGEKDNDQQKPSTSEKKPSTGMDDGEDSGKQPAVDEENIDQKDENPSRDDSDTSPEDNENGTEDDLTEEGQDDGEDLDGEENDDQGEPKEIKVNFIKSLLKIDGTVVDSSYSKELEKDQKARLELEFNTSLLDGAHTDKSWFEFTLPSSILELDGNFHGEKVATSEHPAYSYTTTNKTVRVMLDGDTEPDFIGATDMKFKFEFDAGFNVNDSQFEQDVVIPNGESGNQTFTLKFVPPNGNQKMTKQSKGVDIRNGERFLKWEVSVNKAGKNLVGAQLTDTLGADHALAGDIFVERFVVDLNGVSSTVDGTLTASTFPVDLTDGRYAYKITYETKVTKDNPTGAETFSNTASFTNTNQTTETAQASVSTTYGEALAKKRLSGNNYESTWEINFNYNQASLTGDASKVTDTLPGVHDIDMSSIKVYEMTIGDDGTADGAGTLISLFTPTPVTDGFEIDFGDTTSAYKIVYTAKLADDFYANNSQTLTNTVTAGSNKKTATHSISEGILTKSYQVNFDTKEILWTVTIKADNEAITGLKLEDRFGGSEHTYVTDSLTVDGTLTVPQSLGETTGFDLTGINITKGATKTIKYRTKYPIDGNGTVIGTSFANTATIKWASSDKDYELSKPATYTPQTTTVNNGSKSGNFDYVEQVFNWAVKVNINKQDIIGATLVDTLGPGHELIEGSFQVRELTLSTGGANADTEGTVGTTLDSSKYSVAIAPDKKSFTLTFTGLSGTENNKAYQVDYQSKDPGPIIGIETDGGNYTNSAVFTSKQKSYPAYKASVPVKKENTLVDKTVKSDGKSAGTYKWVIKVNESFSNLGNVVVKDKPSDNLMLLPDTIQIREMKIDKSGNITEKTGWINVDPSNLTLTADGGFTLNLGMNFIIPSPCLPRDSRHQKRSTSPSLVYW